MRGTPGGGNTAEERGSHRQRAHARIRAADAVVVRETQTMRELDRWRYLWRQRRRRCLDLVVLHRDHRRVSNVARHRQDAKGDHDKEAHEQCISWPYPTGWGSIARTASRQSSWQAQLARAAGARDVTCWTQRSTASLTSAKVPRFRLEGGQLIRRITGSEHGHSSWRGCRAEKPVGAPLYEF